MVYTCRYRIEWVVNQMKHQCHVVLGISGSLRKTSSNTWLLSSIGGMMPAGIEFRMYQGLASLPHFSPDLDGDEAQSNEAVREWREELRSADAIVICTPEYARGVPGSLKNALDWVVSSGEFMNMPTAVISASPHPDGGATALQSLTLTLKMMSAAIPDEASLAVPFISKMIGPNGSMTDTKILSSLLSLVQALSQAIPEK
jgi:chromate reductase